MYYDDLGLADLKLDQRNPRHAPVPGQREAINALIDEQGGKLVKLGEDIVAHGLSPIDTLLVFKDKNAITYTVIEGNRRVAVLKLLANPDLAKDRPGYRERFRKLSQGVTVPDTVRCTVIATREEGKHWQDLRHGGGERGGVAVVPWSAEAAHRFAGQRGSQADRAVAFVDAVEAAFPDNKAIQNNLATVRKTRLTTLGRLLVDPSARDRLGLEFSGGALLSHYAAQDIEAAVARILADLATTLTVSELKTKGQRMKYLSSLKAVTPDGSTYLEDAIPLPASKAKKKTTSKKETKKEQGPKKLYEGVQLANLGPRVSNLLKEIQSLDVDKFPNAAAALNRVLMELAVGQVHANRNMPEPKDLRSGVLYCLAQIDPKSKDPKYQPVRNGLQDGTSMLAVRTMQAYMHNPYWHPTPSEVRLIAANYSAFLTALDALG